MRSLLDLVRLLTESIHLALKEGVAISSAWITAAVVAAGAAYFLCGFFCRLWNRHYRFTPVHFAAFSLAAFLSAYGVLLWPGSAKLESAMTNRVQKWKEHLLTGEVVVDKEIIELARQSKVEALVETRKKIAWTEYMGLELRKNGIERGTAQNPGTFSSIATSEDGFRSSGAKVFVVSSEAFEQMNPYLRTRAGQAFTSERSQAFAEAYVAEWRKSGGVGYQWSAGEIGNQIAAALTPQVEQLAYRTRVVGVIGCFAAILLPGVISGIVSYFQIHTGVLRATRRGTSARTSGRR
jgi:hypothetical protein